MTPLDVRRAMTSPSGMSISRRVPSSERRLGAGDDVRAGAVGTGAGAGFTVNLGWDCVSTGVSMGNADYAEVLATGTQTLTLIGGALAAREHRPNP